MSSPIISVTIPTFNRADLLTHSIESVLNQTFSDFEIIVADNASPDNTIDVVESFKDSRIHLYRHKKNIGATANWRFVVSKATSNYIAPLADDDLYLPDHLETALNALKAYPQVAYYTCPAEYFGRDLGSPYYRPKAISDISTPLLFVTPQKAVDFLGSDNPGPMNCMVCRREAIHKKLHWGPPGYLPQDLLIMTQLMVQGGFVFGNKPLARFRVHESNTSLSTQRKKILRFNCMVWYGVRWLTDFLIDTGVNTVSDIENHGMQSPFLERHIVPLVLGLASYDSRPEFRNLAKRIFVTRHDADSISGRFRLARRVGFWVIPFLEKIAQLQVGWFPPRN